MGKNFLEIDNVTFAASEKSKVNNVSLTIENEGDIICLLGPSGIGKTTILRTIAGLEKIQSGTISLKNKIISSKNVHIEPENRNISLAFQDNSLFPHYNVIQNIQFGAERNKKKKKTLTIDEVVEFLHLEHDDKSNLKLEVVDRKFRGTNFIYTLKTLSNLLIPVFVHSHHIHQHEVDEKFGIKRPINIDHIVCF
ncbi:ATP-binding cassette domain-containing protein [bacterium]|nr:ATP-binding cassette domain-containing protein [bacterium]